MDFPGGPAPVLGLSWGVNKRQRKVERGYVPVHLHSVPESGI